MKKIFLTFIVTILISQITFAQEDDLTTKQIASISRIMNEVKAMSQKNNEIIAFEIFITNGEYSLKNAIVQKDNNWGSDSAKVFFAQPYDGYRKDFVIFCSRNDILICDNEEPECLGYAVMSCGISCESNCYKAFYLP